MAVGKDEPGESAGQEVTATTTTTNWHWIGPYVYLPVQDVFEDPIQCLVTFTIWFASFLLIVYLIRRISWWNHPLYFDTKQLPVVPYVLPFIGSAYSFRADVLGFVKRWSTKFNNAKMFGAYVAGRVLVVVVDPFVAAHIISGRVPQLTWHRARYMMMKNGLNSSEEGASIMSQNRTVHAVMEKYLTHGDKFDSFFEEWQTSFHEKILPTLLASRATNDMQGNLDKSDEWTEYHILDLLGRAIFRTAADVFLGDEVMGTEEYYERAMLFESRFFKLSFMPKSMQRRFPKECKARDVLLEQMKIILQRDENTDGKDQGDKGRDLSELIRELNLQFKELDIDDLSAFDYLFFTGSFINAIPTIFWAIYELLADKAAYKAITEEVLDIYSSRNNSAQNSAREGDLIGHPWSMAELDRMVKNDSLVNETLRLRSTTLVSRIRSAVEDFNLKLTIDGETKIYPVKKGTLFFTLPTMMHRDEEIFKDATTFKWDRFLPDANGNPPIFKKNGQVLRRPVEAFGGGPTMCPGRGFAKAEIKTIVASFVLNFDVRFAGDVMLDRPAMKYLGTSASFGMPDSDVPIELRKRKRR